MRATIATAACAVLIAAQPAAAETTLTPGVYDLGNVTYQFSSLSCPFVADRFLGGTNTSDDGYLYFPGMGQANARIEFPIVMWPRAQGNNIAPYAPGMVVLHLPKAPAKNLGHWSGQGMMDYKPVPGIAGYTQAPFGPEAWNFSFSLANVTSETAAGEITISFANGCAFYLGNTPGQPIFPTLIRRIGAERTGPGW